MRECEDTCAAEMTPCSFDTTCIPALECFLSKCNGRPSTACVAVCGLDSQGALFDGVFECFSDCVPPASATVLLSSNITFTGVGANSISQAREAVLAVIHSFLLYNPYFVALHDQAPMVLFEYAVLVPIDVADDVRAAIRSMNNNPGALLEAIRQQLALTNSTALLNNVNGADITGSDPSQTVSTEPSTSDSSAGVGLPVIVGVVVGGIVLIALIVAVTMRSRRNAESHLEGGASNPGKLSTFENPLYESTAPDGSAYGGDGDGDYEEQGAMFARNEGAYDTFVFQEQDTLEGGYLDTAPPLDEADA